MKGVEYITAKTKTAFILLPVVILLLFAALPNGAEAGSIDKDKEYTLSECIDLAVNNSPKISAALSRVKQHKEALRIARAVSSPSLDTEIKYNRLTESTYQKKKYLDDSLNDYQADIILKQAVYTGGRTGAKIRAARYGLEAADKEYESVLNNTVFNVKVAYYKLLYSFYMLKSKKELLKSMQWFYETSLDLNRKTKIPRKETLLRIEVQLNQVRQNLITAGQNYKTAQKNLLTVMGMDISEQINIASLPEPSINEGGYLRETVIKAPEIDAAGSRIKEAREITREAKSGYYPGINAFISYGYEWPGFEAGDTRWTAGAVMNLSLWNRGRNKAEVKKSKERERELAADMESLVNTLEFDLEAARLKYKSARSKNEIASKNLDLAKKSLEMYEKRYNNTTASSIELLDSQKALSEAQEAYAFSLLDLRTAEAEIDKITGAYFENK